MTTVSPLVTVAGVQKEFADSFTSEFGFIMLAGIDTLSLGHEPIVVAEAAAVGELLAVSRVLVIEPPPVVSSTGPLRPRLETDGFVRLRGADRLTCGLTGKPVAVTQTVAVGEGSEQT